MPNYKYKCFKCDNIEIFNLPISYVDTDPKSCLKCDGDMQRLIIGPSDVVVPRETLGKWFKNNTGKELLGGE